MSSLGNKKLLRIYAKHEPYKNGHLEKVLNEMIVKGPPTIKCIDYRNRLYAIEGSHRLAAAHYLGMVPSVDLVSQDRFDPVDDEFWDSLNKNLPHYTWII